MMEFSSGIIINIIIIIEYFPNLLNCLKEILCLLFYVGAYSDLRKTHT